MTDLKKSDRSNPKYEAKLEKIDLQIEQLSEALDRENSEFDKHKADFRKASDTLSNLYTDPVKNKGLIFESNKSLYQAIKNKRVTTLKILEIEAGVNRAYLRHSIAKNMSEPVALSKKMIFWGYISITLIGFLSTTVFYLPFGINILEYVDWQYFLLAGLRYPSSYAFILITALFTLIVMAAAEMGNLPLAKVISPLVKKPFVIPISIFLFFLVSTSSHEFLRAQAVKKNPSDALAEVITSKPLRNWNQLVYVGHTSKFAFFGLPGKKLGANILKFPVQNITCFTKHSGPNPISSLMAPLEYEQGIETIHQAISEITVTIENIRNGLGEGVAQLEKAVRDLPNTVMQLVQATKTCDWKVWQELEAFSGAIFLDISESLTFMPINNFQHLLYNPFQHQIVIENRRGLL